MGGDRRPLTTPLSPALRAFDALAGRFDERFGTWASVAAQRRAVRRELLAAFPEGASLLELGGGTGEDALFLAGRGRRIFLTDGAPAMVEKARQKAATAGLAERIEAETVAIEDLPGFASRRASGGKPSFDGAYSNFAAFNCVSELPAAGRGLANLLRAGGRALLVVFGPWAPGEVVTLLCRGRPGAAFRRLSHVATARIEGREFTVAYPRPRDFASAFAPWFTLRRVLGVGIFVPPSSAEPEISQWPRLLGALEALDRLAARPLGLLGDHVLLDFERTSRSP